MNTHYFSVIIRTVSVLLFFWWWLTAFVFGQWVTIDSSIITSSAVIESNYTPVNFIGPWNDFVGMVVWLTNKKLENPIELVAWNGPTITCRSQIRWLYFNSQRGERLRPLDQETAADFGWIDDGLQITWGRYTDCDTKDNTFNRGLVEYSVFGAIDYLYSGIRYSLIAGAEMDYATNSLWSRWINGLQYVNNKTPVWYIYDSVWGIGFVGGRVSDSARDDVVSSEIRSQHQQLLTDLSDSSINDKVSQSWWDISLFGNLSVYWYKNSAAINTRLGFSVLGNIGIGHVYTDMVKRSILWNPWAQSNISEIWSVNASHRLNQAKKNAHALCRWLLQARWGQSIWYSADAICIQGADIDVYLTTDGHDTIAIHDWGSFDRFYVDGRVVITDSDVYMYNTHGLGSQPLELYVEWNVYLDTSTLITINGQWFASSASDAVTSWVFYKTIMIVDGLLQWVDNQPITHKVYIHGKVVSLNTPTIPTSWRLAQLWIDPDVSDIVGIEIANLFVWRCNPRTGVWWDGVSCSNTSDQFSLIPFVVIDQHYSSRLLTQ